MTPNIRCKENDHKEKFTVFVVVRNGQHFIGNVTWLRNVNVTYNITWNNVTRNILIYQRHFTWLAATHKITDRVLSAMSTISAVRS